MNWLHSQVCDNGAHSPLAAKFYCGRNGISPQKPEELLAHLALQVYIGAAVAAQRHGPRNTEFDSYYQMKEKVAHLVKNLTGGKQATHETPMILEIRTLIRDLVSALEGQVYFVIDVLDEFPRWSNEFAHHLVQLVKTSDNLHVLLSSRPDEDIQNALCKPPTINFDPEKSCLDMSSYVKDHLKAIRRFSKDQKRTACHKIISKANGMFQCKLIL